MGTLNKLLEGFLITPSEAIFFAFLAGSYVIVGRYKSLLLVTLVFSYYWGFKNLLEILSVSGGVSQDMIFLYVGSGIAMFGLVSVNYLMK